MCGRTSCHLPPDALARACAYRDRRGQQRLPDWRAPGRYRPSYNQGPRSVGPVLLSRLHLDKNADSSERILTPMRWGLVPSWFKESDPCKLQFNTANCRSDTMMEKRSFKVPLGKGRRCVVLADGFYEWQRQQGATQRQPYFIYFPQIKTEQGSPPALTSGGSSAADSPGHPEKAWDSWRLLTMAGIFDCWAPPEGGDPLYSYTIITVDSCKGLEDIHHRMPAILDGDEAVSKWLDFGEVPIQEALTLIRPTENITFHPVSPVVNSVRNNTPECLAPVNLVVSKPWKTATLPSPLGRPTVRTSCRWGPQCPSTDCLAQHVRWVHPRLVRAPSSRLATTLHLSVCGENAAVNVGHMYSPERT
ncbi:embryonic stem cell-specific 5-hydroxymethylcytosine-binding protein isoform X1 [Tupaia chinensis]|uniref:embryonic stem cell-specific 5-hydroxymethylcytosine-binding protein isoform X1 n=1 Tax=Tupaia chinensis TaxID=246437 RepID=UPI000703D194|nr:embryonic stem cell-specific 5-hydroxymethylcytosine-binding protein isoform X1 [Tupaia chinensis]